MSYTTVEPAAVKFYYDEKLVLQVYMRELRLYMEAAPDVKIGIGVTNPTTNFDVGNYIFLKNLRGMTEKMSFQLTNPGYNNEPYSFVPVGTIVIWGGSSIPENWLECNGQSVLQVSYPNLYAAMGYKYTSTATQNANASKPDEEKVFQVPDFRGGVGIIQRDVGGISINRTVGARYPDYGGNGVKENDVDIATQFAPLRSSLIQQFVMKSEQLPPHRHDMQVSSTNDNGVAVTNYAMIYHRHVYTRGSGSTSVTAGSRGGIYYSDARRTTGSASVSHKHEVLNCRLLEAHRKETFNAPFSIEQQYIIMRYIIKAT